MVLKLYIEAKKNNRAVAQTLQTTLSWGHDEELNKNSQTEIVCGWGALNQQPQIPIIFRLHINKIRHSVNC